MDKYYIYLETKRNNQIRANSTVNENCNFDTAVKNDLTKGIALMNRTIPSLCKRAVKAPHNQAMANLHSIYAHQLSQMQLNNNFQF